MNGKHKKARTRRFTAIILMIMICCSLGSSVCAQGDSRAQLRQHLREHGPYPELIQDVSLEEGAQIACDHLNEKYRIPAGMGALEVDPALCILANKRAREFYFHFSHFTPDGSQVLYDMSTASHDKPTTFGENLVVVNYHNEETKDFLGYEHSYLFSENMKEAIDMYTLSVEGHYENMTYPSYTKIGVGVYYDEIYHELFVCHLFMS